MKASRWLFGALLLSAVSLGAQQPSAVRVTAELHHHLALENSYVRLFQVVVPPNDATLLHQHDNDYVYVMIGAAQIDNLLPGKPPVTLNLADGQVNFTRGGFAHIARNDASTPFVNVTIELLHPQGSVWNLCAGAVLANAPVKPDATCWGSEHPPAIGATAEFETEKTRVSSVYISARNTLKLDGSGSAPSKALGFNPDPAREHLFIFLDPVSVVSPRSEKSESLRPGDFIWVGRGDPSPTIQSGSSNQVRFVMLEFARADD
jgi:hypothetical protein